MPEPRRGRVAGLGRRDLSRAWADSGLGLMGLDLDLLGLCHMALDFRGDVPGDYPGDLRGQLRGRDFQRISQQRQASEW